MSTKLDDAFATLRNLITDQTRDLAMAMAELASVAQQRDKALTERDASRAGYAAMNTRIYGPGGECHELDKARAEQSKLKIERDSANWSLSRAKESLRAAEQEVEELDTLCNDFRRANARLVAERDAAMERLNHAESIIMQ